MPTTNWDRRRTRNKLRRQGVELRNHNLTATPPERHNYDSYTSKQPPPTPQEEALLRARCGRRKVAVTLPTIRGLYGENSD